MITPLEVNHWVVGGTVLVILLAFMVALLIFGAGREHSYLMTVIATASNPRFWVSRVDIDRGGPTYTIDTLRDLAAQLPDADLYFITGADALADIFTWR